MATYNIQIVLCLQQTDGQYLETQTVNAQITSEKSYFDYQDEADTSQILNNADVESFTNSHSTQYEPFIWYNDDYDKVLGQYTSEEPYLKIYIYYKRFFTITYIEDSSTKTDKKYVGVNYAILLPTGQSTDTVYVYNSDTGLLLKEFTVMPSYIWDGNDGDKYYGGQLYTTEGDLTLSNASLQDGKIYKDNAVATIATPKKAASTVSNSITVNYDTQGGIPTVATQTFDGIEEYTFSNWKGGSQDIDFTDDSFFTIEDVEIDSTSGELRINIIPVFISLTPYCEFSTVIKKAITPSRASYQFLGWSTNSEKVVRGRVSGEVTIYAIWQSEIEYTSEFESTMHKVPYKLEVWEDQFDATTGQWDEIRLVCLASNTMEDQGRAFNIKFTQNVYGELKLSFSLYGTYIDTQTGEKVKNPLMNYCFNESKVKLCYDGEWYDFIIKSIQETHNQQFTKVYTCQYLPMYELSKTGYAQVFSLDSTDGSGIQSAPDFIEDILEGTEWKYIQAGTPDTIVEDLEIDLSESNEEIVYYTPVKAGAPIVYKNFYFDENGFIKFYQDENGDDVESTYEDSSVNIYLPYSALGKPGDIFGCAAYDLKVDGDLILKSNLVYITNMPWSDDEKGYSINDFAVSGLTMQVPKKSDVSEWVDAETKDGVEVKEYCNKGTYEENGVATPIYCHTITMTTDSAIKYTATIDYMPCAYGIIDEDTYKKEKKLLDSGKETKDIYFTFYRGDNYFYFPLNKVCDISSFGYSEIPLGMEYRYYITSTEATTTIVGIIGNITEANKALWDTATSLGVGEVTSTDGIVCMKLQAVNYDSLSSENDQSTLTLLGSAIPLSVSDKTYYQKLGDDTNPYYRPYTDLAIPTSTGFPTDFYEAEISSEDITMTSSQVSSMKEYFILDNDGFVVIKGHATTIDDKYFYQEDASGVFYYDIVNGEYTLIQPDNSDGKKYSQYKYTPLESYVMYRSMEASQSNCFDLTQKVAETFEVWCKYIIEHDDDGRIEYDDNGRRKKWVTLASYAGLENPLGFTYGINLKSLQRDIKTESLVTKLYVDYSENEYTDEGYVAISSATDNVSKEDIIYNFDYYIQVGLLDKMQVYNDLYKIESSSQAQEDPVKIKCVIEKDGSDGAGYLRLLGLLNEQYDKIYETINGSEGYSYQVVHLKELYLAYDYATAVSDGYVQNYLSEDSYNGDVNTRNELLKKYNQATAQLAIAKKQLTRITDRKSELSDLFAQRYARYIQEGNWTSSDYIDSDKYYTDALKVSNDGAKPNVSYSFSAIDLYALPEYSHYKFRIGDRTWVEDPDYFGYEEDGTPYHESVIITEMNFDLDNPSQSTFSVQNYSNKFEDLFQTLSATAQSYSLNQTMYGRASKLLPSGSIDGTTVQKSLTDTKELTLMLSSAITFDNNGITIKNLSNANQVLRLASDGISFSTDGGTNFDQRLTW